MHKARTENQGLTENTTKTRDSQTQILVPRFTRKQNKGRGEKKKKTCSNIQNTKKKSYLKVALFFCCKREEGNDAMR